MSHVRAPPPAPPSRSPRTEKHPRGSKRRCRGTSRLSHSPHPSSSAAQIFDGYEKEFLEFTASIARNTASLPNLDGGASPATLDARARTNTRPSVVSSSTPRATDAHTRSCPSVTDTKSQRVGLIEADIAEAEALIRRMDLEARSLQNPAVKTPLLSKLRDYKAEMQRLKRESALAAKAANAAADRSQLLAGAQLDDMNAPTSQSQRDRMLQTTARLDQTGDRIREGKRSLLETEELGVSILQDLHRQRETITNARESIHGADDNIGRSRKILAAMGRRAMANKLMMYGIIAMLVTAISVIAYFKLIK